MTGWLIFTGLGAILFGVLWRFGRAGRGAVELIAATILIAAAGYAWQGSPGLPGAAPRPPQTAALQDDAFAVQREALGFAKVGGDADTLAAADSLFHQQAGPYAIGVLRAGLNANPKSMALWTGLGNALVRQADGIVTPAARLAFDRAAQADPNSPAPTYFLAMAYARMGDLDGAEALWRHLLTTAPAQAQYMPLVIQDLLILKALRAQR